MFTSSYFDDVVHVYLTGGEPFLNGKIVKICEAIKNRLDATVSFNTNGLHPENIREYVKAIRALGLNILSLDLSVDGPEEMHDYTRGVEGGFKKLMRSHEVVEALGLNHCWNYTIFKPTLSGLEWYQSNLQGEAKSYAFGLPKKFLGTPNKELFDFTPEELTYIYDKCGDAGLRGYLDFIKSGAKYFSPCEMGSRQIRLDPEGVAYACDEDPCFRLGKAQDLTVEDANRRVKLVKYYCRSDCGLEYCLYGFNQLMKSLGNRILVHPFINHQLTHRESAYQRMKRMVIA